MIQHTLYTRHPRYPIRFVFVFTQYDTHFILSSDREHNIDAHIQTISNLEAEVGIRGAHITA